MNNFIISFEEAIDKPVSVIGGKAFNLVKIAALDFPVPAGMIVTTHSFNEIMNQAQIENKINELFFSSLTQDEMEKACSEIEKSITNYTLSSLLENELERAFHRLNSSSPALIVRSSATMEDTAATSFAGMLTSWPNITTFGQLISAIKKCWSSVFSPRVVLYSKEKKIKFQEFGVAVILQEMIVPEKSGLVFSKDPTLKNKDQVVVEAILGFGEDIVSGEITPERYLFSTQQKRVTFRKRGRQEEYLLPSGEKKKISPRFKSVPILSDKEVLLLSNFSLKAEEVFGAPQDMEWAFAQEKFYILQSRPLIFSHRDEKLFPQIGEHTVILRGAGVSPRVGSGETVILEDKHIHLLSEKSVVVIQRLTNDLAIHLRYVAAVVANEGGATSHGANILREFQIPCVLATGNATRLLKDGDIITVDGFRGVVYQGDLSIKHEEIDIVPDTKTKIFVSILVPEQAVLIAPHADGISSMRDDYFILESGVHPKKLINEGGAEILEETLFNGVVKAAEMFKDKPLWYKTMDAPTDEFRRLEGGDEEPEERNPLLGWRGIGRELQEPELLNLELGVIRKVVEKGYNNIGIKIPFIRFVEEYEAFKKLVKKSGLEPHQDVKLGISVETPGTVLSLQDFIDCGLDFISIGTSDLVMCTLALDRECQMIADKFIPSHPAVVYLLKTLAETAHKNNIFTCVCGESARDPDLLPILLKLKIDAIGVSIPYFTEVKKSVYQLENRLKE